MMKYFLLLFGFFAFSVSVLAVDDFVSEDSENEITGTSSSDFILDSADNGDDVKLQFGNTLNEFLQWNNTEFRFEISNDLRVIGNIEQAGNILILDADNAGVGADTDIISHQGTDNNGALRYSASNNRWEISNDGGAFTGIAAGGTLLTFDETIGNGSSVAVNHATDTNNQRIVQIKEHITSSGDTDNSLDFDVADEANYIQENAVTGTDFPSGTVVLNQSFTGGSGTTNLALSQTATASTSSQPASNGNDGNNNTFWYTTASGSNGGWWQVDLGTSPLPVNSVGIRWYNTTGTYNCSTFEIQGTNTDGSGYTTVFTGNTVSDPQESTYNFTPSTYRYWRLLCAAANNTSYYVLREARLFEALATYPTTPFYVTTNSNNLSTSNWTGVTNITTTQDTPASTSVLYLVSFDGRTTWKYWNGSAWAISSLANLQTQGMTKAEIEALSSANWLSAGGINSDPAKTLDFAFDLSTTDNSVTPSVDEISVTYSTPDYWRINTPNYSIQEFSTNETQVTNNTGATQDVKISILIP